jgi:hypothetical protein
MIDRRTFIGTSLAALASSNLLSRPASVANDLDYRNNIIANSLYVWIGQGARSAQAELDQIGRGRAGGPPSGGPPLISRLQDRCLPKPATM